MDEKRRKKRNLKIGIIVAVVLILGFLVMHYVYERHTIREDNGNYTFVENVALYKQILPDGNLSNTIYIEENETFIPVQLSR